MPDVKKKNSNKLWPERQQPYSLYCLQLFCLWGKMSFRPAITAHLASQNAIQGKYAKEVAKKNAATVFFTK